MTGNTTAKQSDKHVGFAFGYGPQELEHQTGSAEVIAKIAADFIAADAHNTDAVIRQALSEIGRYAKADRCYAAIFSGGQWLDNWGWQAESEKLAVSDGRKLLLSILYGQRLEPEGRQIFIPETAALPAAAPEKGRLLEMGVHSLINIPMHDHGQLLGCIGLEASKADKPLEYRNIGLLKCVSALFANFLSRKLNEGAIAESEQCSDRRQSEACNLSLLDIAVKVQEERPIDEIVHLACNRIKEIFGVRLVWVGYKEPDGVIRLTLSGQDSEDYMAGVVVRWDESPEGEGLTGTAIRTGRFHIMNIEDPRLTLWRERLEKYAVRSGASFPLKVGSSVLGALTVYTDDPEFWQKWTIVHLTNFAKQIAIAIQATTIRQRVKLLTTGLKFAANAVVITNRTGSIQWVNPAFLKLHGYSEAEALGSNVSILESSQHPQSFYKAIKQRLSQGRIWHGEIYIRRKDGTIYTSETTITPVRDETGRITNFISIIQDVTQRKKAESDMLEARALLASNERLNALGIMAAGIAHEINQPLNSLKVLADGMLYWYQQGVTPEVSEAMETFQEISKQAERIDAIIKHTRSIVKGRQSDKLVPCNLNQAVEDSLLLFSSQFAARGIRLTKNMSIDLPQILGGRTQLEQVVINLLSNAIQALDSVQKPDKRISIATGKSRGNVFLTVSDNGAGISKELRSRVFDPFFTTKSAGQGMGLGLSIVHTIVTACGGQVRIEDNKPSGVSFRIEFPAVAGKRKGDAV